MGQVSEDMVMHVEKNKQVCLAAYPEGMVTQQHLQVKQVRSFFVLKPGSDDVLLQTLWVSVDPYLRLRMLESADGLYFNTFQIGQPLSTAILAKVLASENPNFKVGDEVVGFSDIAEFVVVLKGTGLSKVDVPGVPKSYHLGVLGLSGFTAWVGLNLIAEMKAGEQVYISAAAGAVGIVAGQLAKLKGCHVVGSAGTDKKVEMLKTQYGFDDAFNYKKEQDWEASLRKRFPNGIDIYFENVGGNMLEAVLQVINRKGRIPVCGMVSQYNQEWTQRDGVRNLMNVVGNCVRMEGFLALNHAETWPQFLKEVTGYIQEGRLHYSEHVFEGMESFPSAFVGIFEGDNIGKTLIKLEGVEGQENRRI
ncbi:hypothetical protein GOP47_0000642 [Adiantum capillus-veneris]|uniref:Enoyl reductase (ER) domain-containing protein n=1 Tax=Adiantum capillus-veneris TaxID=13818 RepID=A0A9D4ZQW7_ADICA|nr:hypothetical protein GOP47_0000642 [Adiantum capillus-veneris]